MNAITYEILMPGDAVRMTDGHIARYGGPRLTGVVEKYDTWKGIPGFIRIRHDSDGSSDTYCPWVWQRISDGAIGKNMEPEDLVAVNQVKPIETSFAGYRFRSRLEARWGCFWVAIGVRFEYEKEGYRLPSGPYLPDFWLPQVSMFAEVKSGKFSHAEEGKCLELANLTRFPVLMLDGQPSCRPYLHANPCDDPEGVVHDFGSVILTNENDRAIHQGRFFSSIDNQLFNDTYRAVNAAMSARFEHGDIGVLGRA